MIVAQGSGESLEDDVTETELVEAHTDKGESVLPWALGVAVVAAGVVAAGPLRTRYPTLSARAITATLLTVALVAGTGATWTVIDVGHSGAKATGDKQPTDSETGDPGEGGSDNGSEDDD